MRKKSFKKYSILAILFFFPVLAYLVFLSGKNNFAKLPTLSSDKIEEITTWKTLSGNPVQFENSITVLGIWGSDVKGLRTNALNLNQKIYKRFYKFEDFQFVILVQNGLEEDVREILSELEGGVGTDLIKWNFVFNDKSEIEKLVKTISPNQLSEEGSTSKVYIIDRERLLRGRDDEDNFDGYDTSSVAELNNKMIDDLKVILAEYRLALKKYNSKRKI